ncbi:MocR-like pyridoxine biosynthesis transcription factor PdxR [Paenibacillus soyae]|uniref:PLP-dependent aminotransferase family protein n=1 Tax=Paenibacillus soyae TaxID=2969249 RepID=A0A9X2MVC3_9BACL|nr:PLP-dependent aminotransferase family protein [Paenibacillus soyae]MCR2806568.1 PLP-dependent aminotransferase family protein [Paenibacillus soyae]
MLWIPIDRSLERPLHKQVYDQVRERILGGELPPGWKLPSTRELADELRVSRNVVLGAYDQLLAEGYLDAERGSGTYVAEGAFLEERKMIAELRNTDSSEDIKSSGEDVIDFRSGIPDLSAFPRKAWARLAREVWEDAPADAFGYGMPEGRRELRQALSDYLLKTRGVKCRPEQIVITSGATQALTLTAKLLTRPDDMIIIEDPITRDIQLIFQQAGARLHPVPADEQGMQSDRLPAGARPAFVFLTPSHQFPLGGTLPIQRRIQLIGYARQNGTYLVEDDYDSEFRHEGQPVSSLQGLDPERVLYIGSFSKILSPALRLGYLVLPEHLIPGCRQLKWFADLHSSSMEQIILARFIEEGGLARHIAKMKKLYRIRRDALIRCLTEAFGERVRISGQSTGLHLVASFTGADFTDELLDSLKVGGVQLYPVEKHAATPGHHRHSLIMGYGHLSPETIQIGITRMREAWGALGR